MRKILLSALLSWVITGYKAYCPVNANDLYSGLSDFCMIEAYDSVQYRLNGPEGQQLNFMCVLNETNDWGFRLIEVN